MDAEERQMFREMGKDVREGFTGVYKRLDEVQASSTAGLKDVQTSINMGKVDQSVLDERLKTHMADDNRHRNPEQEQEQRDQEQRARRERREDKKGSGGSWPEWLTFKLILSTGLGIGAVIAGIVSAFVM